MLFNFIGKLSPAHANVVLKGHHHHQQNQNKSSQQQQESGKPNDKTKIQITRQLPDPNISPIGHVLLALIFWGLFVAAVVVSTLDYVNAPPVTTQALVPSDRAGIPRLSVILDVECKDFAGSSSSSTCGDMLLTVNYSNFPNSACVTKDKQNAGVVVWTNNFQQVQRKILFDPSTNNNGIFDLVMTQNQIFSGNAVNNKIFYEVPLCFTAQESLKLTSVDPEASLELSMIQVGFKNLTGNAGATLNVEVKWRGNTLTSSVKKLINVNEDHSVRVLPIYATIEEDLNLPTKSNDDYGKIISFTPSADVIQFEGFRPATSDRSDVLIVLQSLTTLRTRQQVFSLWDLITNVGSTFETLTGAFVVVIPVWSWIFVAKGNWITRFLRAAFDSSEKKNGGGDDDEKEKPYKDVAVIFEDEEDDDGGEKIAHHDAKKNPVEMIHVKSS